MATIVALLIALAGAPAPDAFRTPSAPRTPDPSAAPNAYAMEVDANHSTVAFGVPIAGGLTRVTGKFNRFRVDIVYHPTDLGRCRVEAAIDAASIQTGIDADLRGEKLFAADRSPSIRFASRSVVKRGEATSPSES
jgi:polyisoprenoid-binding protein YceI